MGHYPAGPRPSVTPVRLLSSERLSELALEYNRKHKEKLTATNLGQIRYHMIVANFRLTKTSPITLRKHIEEHGFNPPSENRIAKVYHLLRKNDAF